MYTIDGASANAAYNIHGEQIFPDKADGWYPHYRSHISTIDGLYSGFNYTNVYIIGNELVVGYLAKQHHFTAMSEGTQIFRVARKNLITGIVTESDAILGMGYCGSVYYDGVYYIFTGSKRRFTTTDWVTFTRTSYTLPSGASEPYYITLADNGRFVSTVSNGAKGSMIYSDDLGVTWYKASGGSDVRTDHGGTCKVGNTLVAYCQNKDGSAKDSSPRRYVLTSTDNGETWASKICEDADLANCGGSHTSGAFCNIGDEWFFAASNRMQWTDQDGYIHLGKIQLFKGTEQDVIDGTMHLHSILDDLNTGYKALDLPDSTVFTDTGNLGMTTDGEKLYCVYMRPLFHVVGTTRYNVSNCMVALSIIDKDPNAVDSPDDYYNPQWQNDLNAEMARKDTSHDLYIYADGDSVITNYAGVIYSKSTHSAIANSSVQPKDDIVIPFNSRFEMCFVGRLIEVANGGSYLQQYIGANINGKDISINGTTNNLLFPRTHSTACAGSISAHFGYLLYLKIKYENGKITTTLNDITIDDLKSRTYYVINENENTILIKCSDVASKIEGGSYKYGMIRSLWIDTDGDLTGLVGG